MKELLKNNESEWMDESDKDLKGASQDLAGGIEQNHDKYNLQ